MKNLCLLVALLIASTANADIYLQNCYEYQRQGVSYSYQSCINRNFQAISNELGTLSSYCSNVGNRVSYFFTSCIERNFTNVESELTDVYLSYCSNFNPDSLSYSFTSCVNRNFSEIQRKLNSLDEDYVRTK